MEGNEDTLRMVFGVLLLGLGGIFGTVNVHLYNIIQTMSKSQQVEQEID